jgi:hypothetical protein
VAEVRDLYQALATGRGCRALEDAPGDDEADIDWPVVPAAICLVAAALHVGGS